MYSTGVEIRACKCPGKMIILDLYSDRSLELTRVVDGYLVGPTRTR